MKDAEHGRGGEMTDPKNERQELYTDAEWQSYTLYYEELIEEQKRRERRDKLNDPEEISKEARQQFGLAKPGEIPYKP